MTTRRSASPGTSTPSQKLIVATSTRVAARAERASSAPFGASPCTSERALREPRASARGERAHRAHRRAEHERAAAA